jgi:hypothetical protein
MGYDSACVRSVPSVPTSADTNPGARNNGRDIEHECTQAFAASIYRARPDSRTCRENSHQNRRPLQRLDGERECRIFRGFGRPNAGKVVVVSVAAPECLVGRQVSAAHRTIGHLRLLLRVHYHYLCFQLGWDVLVIRVKKSNKFTLTLRVPRFRQALIPLI